jgi:hypothetical protein
MPGGDTTSNESGGDRGACVLERLGDGAPSYGGSRVCQCVWDCFHEIASYGEDRVCR